MNRNFRALPGQAEPDGNRIVALANDLISKQLSSDHILRSKVCDGGKA